MWKKRELIVSIQSCTCNGKKDENGRLKAERNFKSALQLKNDGLKNIIIYLYH